MSGRAPTLLVADDNVAVSKALEMLFVADGWRVVTTTRADDVLALVRRSNADVALLDMNFAQDTTSGQEGIDLLRALRAQRPELPVILMTAWATVERAVEAMKLGARDYVGKPWDNEQLVGACRTQLALTRARRPSGSARAELDQRAGFTALVGESSAMLSMLRLVGEIAPTDATVLLTGEGGTGKELVAQAIHASSRRSARSFVKVNMGALPEALVERELFGHVRGAFTDASTDRPGRFAAAAGGSILLDEIGTLPPQHQVKLLRVLQEREYEPLGSTQPVKADVRVIAATNADLKAEMATGRFRRDLYYRLNVVEVRVPSLRERGADVLLLANHFVGLAASRHDRAVRGFTDAANQALLRHPWPGNVRELQHLVERAVILGAGEREWIDEADLFQAERGETTAPSNDTLESMERATIERTLVEHAWNVSRTAQALGLTRQALYRRMERFGLVKL
jgi:DNA-binding NtrC family response regulator